MLKLHGYDVLDAARVDVGLLTCVHIIEQIGESQHQSSSGAKGALLVDVELVALQ